MCECSASQLTPSPVRQVQCRPVHRVEREGRCQAFMSSLLAAAWRMRA